MSGATAQALEVKHLCLHGSGGKGLRLYKTKTGGCCALSGSGVRQ